MKKTLCAIIAALLLISTFPMFSVSAEEELQGTFGDVIYYVEEDGTATVYGPSENAGVDIVIPRAVDGYPVKRINRYAFSGNTKIRSVAVSEGIEEIGFQAFFKCTKLETITLPTTLTDIARSAFENTKYYLNSQNWVNGILYIDTNLIKAKKEVPYSSVIVDEGTTCIAYEAFEFCKSITDVTLPDTIRAIGDDAFANCTALESINLNDSIVKIGWSAFSACENLKSILIPSSLKVLEQNVFFKCSSLEEITIPEGVTTIERSAFKSCTGIKSVVVPESVTDIQDWAFLNCTALCHITLPQNLSHLGTSIVSSTAFYNNPDNWENGVLYIGKYLVDTSSLTEGKIIIKDGTERLSDYAFLSLNTMTSVYIPDSVIYMGRGTFQSAENLESVRLPASLDEIPAAAFAGCKILESIAIPETVTKIGDNAFLDCDSLKSVAVPSSVTEIGTEAFGHYTVFDSIGDMALGTALYKDFTLRGIKDSSTDKYAAAEGIKFEEIKIGTFTGDTDGDGTLTVKDATAIQKHLAEIEVLLKEQLPVCDATENGKLTISDATAIQKKVAGL